MKLIRFLATTTVAFGIYLLITMTLELHELLLGAGAACISGLIVVRFVPMKLQTFNPLRIFRAVLYAPVFIYKMIVANLQIAAVVLRPKLRISPSILRARSDLKTPEGRLILTNSITLTPGTLSVDVKSSRIYVHVVNYQFTEDSETKKQILLPFEKHIKGISK